jgi:hypothetical protein
MSPSKKIFLRGDPFDARNLARMFEQLTGRRASQAEIEAAQKKLDDLAEDLAPSPRRDAPRSPSKQRQQRGPHPATTAPTRVAPAAGKKPVH